MPIKKPESRTVNRPRRRVLKGFVHKIARQVGFRHWQLSECRVILLKEESSTLKNTKKAGLPNGTSECASGGTCESA
jgi:hypothetical protein